MLLKSILCHKEIACERKVNWLGKLPCSLFLRNHHSQLQQLPLWSDQSSAIIIRQQQNTTGKKMMTHWRLRWQHFLEVKNFKIRYVNWVLDVILLHTLLIDYSIVIVNITFICAGKPNNSCDLHHCYNPSKAGVWNWTQTSSWGCLCFSPHEVKWSHSVVLDSLWPHRL